MSISLKTSVAMVVIATIGTALLTAYALEYFPTEIFRPTGKVNVNVEYVFEKFEGISVDEIHNVITNKGEIHSRNAFSRGNEENVSKLAVGNATGTLQTKTVLDAVYDDPTDGEYVEGTIVEWVNVDEAYNSTYKWTFEETVRLDSGAAYLGNTTFAYAIANFSGGAQTFSSGENLTVRFTFTYDAND